MARQVRCAAYAADPQAVSPLHRRRRPETAPYGRWEERLTSEFVSACEPLVAEAGSAVDPETIRWFPDRLWGGRVYVPVSARAADATADEDGDPSVRVLRLGLLRSGEDDGEPAGSARRPTSPTSPPRTTRLEDRHQRRRRRRLAHRRLRGGDVTLIWGLPLVRGAVAATAELDGETIDQAPVHDGRFTLVAVDAVHGFGDDLFLEVKLWNRSVRELASESLYAEAEEEDDADEAVEPG